MHVHTPVSASAFPKLLATKDRAIADQYTDHHRKFAVDEPMHPIEGSFLSLARLYERLSLLAQLELPCTISILTPPLCLCDTIIRTVEFSGDDLTIAGDKFNLRLRGANIHSIRLSNRQGVASGITSVDIHHSHEMLYARIEATPDGLGSAVWRDVMDNPTLSFA